MHGLQKILADTTNAGEKRIGTGGKTGMTVEVYSMFVTPKDVDETIKYLSFMISEGLNIAFSQV